MKKHELFLKRIKKLSRENVVGDILNEKLCGKRVEIVGPSDNENGKEIDEFDVIIRLNTVLEYFPFTKELKRKFGSRTDIIYSRGSPLKKYYGDDKLWKSVPPELKIIRSIVGHDKKIMAGSYNYPAYFKKLGLDITEVLCPETIKFVDNALQLEKGSNLKSRTGLVPIIESVMCGAKEVKVFNMTFYHGGTNVFRKDSVQELNPKTYHTGKKTSEHDSYVELKLFKILMKNYPSISVDEKLRTIITKGK